MRSVLFILRWCGTRPQRQVLLDEEGLESERGHLRRKASVMNPSGVEREAGLGPGGQTLILGIPLAWNNGVPHSACRTSRVIKHSRLLIFRTTPMIVRFPCVTKGCRYACWTMEKSTAVAYNAKITATPGASPLLSFAWRVRVPCWCYGNL